MSLLFINYRVTLKQAIDNFVVKGCLIFIYDHKCEDKEKINEHKCQGVLYDKASIIKYSTIRVNM